MKIGILLLVLLLSACSPTATTFVSPIVPGGDLPPAGDTALLQAILMALINGGLAGAFVAWFLERPVGVLLRSLIEDALAPSLGIGPRLVGRLIAIVLTAAVALAFYAVAMAFGFVENPGSLAAWLNLTLYLAGLSFPASQLIHGMARDARSP